MSFSIPITKNISEINLQQGVFIFIHRASKVPPHIGMAVNGLLFEISTVGPGYTYKAVELLKTAQKRGVGLIYLELKQASQNPNELQTLMTDLVRHYHKVDEEITCLFPIKDFIQEVYHVEVSKANFIFDLLPILYKNNCIISSYEVNLTDKLKHGSFELKKYTKQDVDKCIAAVNRKNNIEVSC